MTKTAEKTKTWQRTKTPGLLRHKGGRYYGRFTLAGKTKFVPLETDLLEIARTRFAEHRARVESSRRAARAAGDGSGTMGHLLTIYQERLTNRAEIAEPTRNRYLQDIGFVKKTWPGFEKLRPDEITRPAVEQWKGRALTQGTGFRAPGAKETTETKGKSPRCFNGGFTVVRRLLDIAVEMGTLHGNVLNMSGIRAREKPRKPHLPDPAILNSIFSEIEKGSGRTARWSEEIADFCRFLAFTGCRLAEANRIRWADVDFTRGIISVHGTKTDSSDREVPIIPAARQLLDKIMERRRKTATIILNGERHVSSQDKILAVSEAGKSLKRACVVIGTEELTHHDLRDAFATTCIESGVDVPTVAAWLGHADGGALLMKVYSHHRRPHSIAQAAKVNFGGTS